MKKIRTSNLDINAPIGSQLGGTGESAQESQVLNNMFIETEGIKIADDQSIIDYTLLSTPRHHEYHGTIVSKVALLLTDNSLAVHSLDTGIQSCILTTAKVHDNDYLKMIPSPHSKDDMFVTMVYKDG